MIGNWQDASERRSFSRSAFDPTFLSRAWTNNEHMGAKQRLSNSASCHDVPPILAKLL